MIESRGGHRGHDAAVGAVLYALSLAGYALATNLTVAFAAAALGGVGGALFWVSVRARVGETGGVAAYGQLLAAEGQGAFIGFIGAFIMLGWLGYPAVFGLGALAALAAAAVMLSRRAAPPPRVADQARGLRHVGRRLGPLLALTAVTATAEAGVGLVLLLHLQREFRLEPFDIAMVFAPGFLVFIFLAGHTHRVTARLGRGVTLALALTGSAATAAGLAFATDQWVIAAIWAVPDLDHARQERRRWFQHLALFAAGQAVFWVMGDSWIAARLAGEVPDDMSGLMTASRIWVTILVVDFLWSFSYTLWPRRRRVDHPASEQVAGSS